MDKNVSPLSGFGFSPNLYYEYPYDLIEMGFSDHCLDHSVSPEIESPRDDGEFSDSVLKYINQMLMEEDLDAKPCMFHNPLALQAAEKSLYEVIGERYPNSPDQHPLSYTDQSFESPDDSFRASVSDSNPFLTSVDGTEHESSSTFQTPISDPNTMSEGELMLQFNRGLEEGNKFLPKGDQLVINLDDYSFSPEANEKQLSGSGGVLLAKAENEETELSFPNGTRERKNHERDESEADFEGERRRSKQFAAYADEAEEETELSELFDKVLLCDRGKSDRRWYIEPDKPGQQSGGRSHRARPKTRDRDDKEVVDLRTLLVSCAQAISVSDFRAAADLLRQIRQHSSPLGDGSQRTAHFFANGLEARLAGTGSEIYASLAFKKTSAADMLKAYQAYVSACPFKKIAIIFANIMILKTAERAERLHIIDFGILYGFQWPAFIYYLSKRAGGPPKLRITGIELPQSGFRPSERVQETGARLGRYCERFGVPFEFDAVAKRFEDVRSEDLRIEEGEALAVTCLLRFKNLLDETVVADNPRDSVLGLIRELRPDIFVHSVVSCSYSAPFFVPRFREALFNFSSFFDLADATLGRGNAMRLMFEREFLGREVVNVVACEGPERVERPETYKQWQVRSLRAGFQSIPLDLGAVSKLKGMVKRGYHGDFSVEEDGHWMLQGWKGKVLYASSCWVPL